MVPGFNSVTQAPTSIPTAQFQIHVMNHGRAAAHLKQIRYGISKSMDLPDIPQYVEAPIHFRDLIGPGTPVRATAVINLPDAENTYAIFVKFEYWDVGRRVNDWSGFVGKLAGKDQFPVPMKAPDAYIEALPG
jgi:hypothetical protein